MSVRILTDKWCMFFFQAEDGIRDLVRSRGLGDVYKRQRLELADTGIEAHISSGSGRASCSSGSRRSGATATVSYTHLTLPTSDLV